ncbi:DMT family transporter [Microvirga alba]|uniref:DMT family transporter n=1 Tax=Microvirga alba TaxID=2791025 RepID=A0A931BKX8_9HYPH|nr:DMT family transporter [Microvirga alba]MBF9232826.1 DMT family transporter [Microvirga alba]
MSGVAVGAAFLIASSIVSTIEVVCVRLLADHASGGQIVLFRALAQVILAGGCVALMGGLPLLRTTRIKVHLLRGALSAGSWWMYYTSFRVLDLALATTLSFSSQIFVVILATMFLGERLTWRRMGATLLGLAGIAVAMQIWNAQAVDGRAIYGLSSAFLGAVMVVITSSLSRTERTPTIMFYIGIVVFIAALPQAALDWKPIGSREVMLLSAVGVLGTAGMWLMVEAYRHAEASSLAPFPYLRLVFSAIAGALLFGEVLQTETFIGAGLIVASALMIIFEARTGRSRKAAANKLQGEKSL